MRLPERYKNIIILIGIVCILAYMYRSYTPPSYENFQTAGSNGNVHIFYHIFCNPTTKAIVKDQTMKILFSGTYDRVSSIKCFLAGVPENIAEIREYLSHLGSKYTIAAEGPNDTTYERFTLERMHEIVQPEYKILYIHSKGTSHESENYRDKIFWWRTWMEYNLIFKSAECISALDTYDIVGAGTPNGGDGLVCPRDKDLKPLPIHFPGNFWWSTGKYFLSLPKKIDSGYCDPESYIFTNNPKYLALDAEKIPKGVDYNSVYPNVLLGDRVA